jgi:nucleotide-binding universal stress UspA family protein
MEQKVTDAGSHTQAAGPVVVVGVDGSPHSLEALEWAAKYVELAGGTMHAVIAWHYPADYGFAAIPDIEIDLEQSAREALQTALEGVRRDHSKVAVAENVLQGPAAQVLVDVSADADLLVIGFRGHGGFADLLLGSVSSHAVHHAKCPVVVVRAREQEAG